MAYNKFKKLEQLRNQLGIKDIMDSWLPKTFKSFSLISSFLKEDLREAATEALTTEKAKSESIVVPIFKELKRANPNLVSYFSGEIAPNYIPLTFVKPAVSLGSVAVDFR